MKREGGAGRFLASINQTVDGAADTKSLNGASKGLIGDLNSKNMVDKALYLGNVSSGRNLLPRRQLILVKLIVISL